jgi:RNA polymerase sigma-70 factor (ECF subfamily)
MGVFGRDRDRAQEFERAALGHLDELVRVASRACGNREAGEDMVQETYMRAWKYWDRFEPGTNCRAWLYRILFNVIRRRRGGSDPSTVSIETPEVGAMLPFEPPPSITASAVGEAFEKLPADFRSALLVVAVEGFSYKEAAEILGVPIGTVMSRLHRGREALRRLVDGRPARPRAGRERTESGGTL